MRRVKVKICGITREEDLEAACNLGADAVGFIVDVPESPRNLTLQEARKLICKVPIFVKSVVVTVLNDVDRVLALYEMLKPDFIQVHGVSLVSDLRRKIPEARLIGAIPVKSEADVKIAVEIAPFIDGVLADSHVAGKYGGTGLTHDWGISYRMKEAIRPKPLILAGGLSPSNVKEAVMAVKPYAVDVSTGVEVRPGVKDPDKIKAFIDEAKSIIINE
ncbi:MAG: phosphoribosylanthranilate isomerase [Candidatus Bathyarchaeia archaeon]